jgi:CHAT domain-containing protein
LIGDSNQIEINGAKGDTKYMRPLVLSRKIRFVIMILSVLLLTATVDFGQTPKQDEARELLPSKTTKRGISGGEKHRYIISLKKDELLRVKVEQKGINVTVELFDDRGEKLCEMWDGSKIMAGIIELLFITDKEGDYGIQISSRLEKEWSGEYSVLWNNDKKPTDKDRKLIQAKNLFVEASNEVFFPSKEKVKSALYKLEKALNVSSEIGDKQTEAAILYYISGIYSISGEEYSKAIKYNYQALLAYQAIGDKNGEANTLINRGLIYHSLGQPYKAIEHYNQASAIYKIKRNKIGEARASLYIGNIYRESRDKHKALKCFLQALSIFKNIKHKRGEVIALINIGKIYSNLEENHKAIEFLKQALLIYKNNQNAFSEAMTVTLIGDEYSKLGKSERAFEHYKVALNFYTALKDKSAYTHSLIAEIHIKLGEHNKALEYFIQTLQLRETQGFINSEAWTLSKLFEVSILFGNLRLAVFYGKQSINKYQELRQKIIEFDKDTQKDYLKTFESTYRKLIDILVTEGRLSEAQQVLAMLKEDEYFDYVRRDPNEIKKLSLRADLRADERAALEKYETLAGKVTEYGTQFAKLEELKNRQGAGFKQQVEYDDLKAKLDAANAAFRIFLEKELAAELGKPAKREIEIDRALQTKLQQWGNGTVALYTVAADERYRVILTTPKTQTDGKTEIKIADLNKKIFEFRAALQNPAVDPRPLGKELYDILIKPIEKDLIAAEAKTLLWSLDGTLRYIPFAALSPDGKTYLAEKYQNVVITSTTRQSLLAETDPNWHLLGAGVTKASRLTEPNGTEEITFSALPGVRTELLKIVSDEDAKSRETGLLTGRRLIDEGFNLASLESGMSQRVSAQKPKYNVIHLATHFRLGGDTAKSFLLLGGNQALTLEKVSDNTTLNFGDVELVTLSACNTGFGAVVENKNASREQERKLLEENNGVEVDSLATFIELRGAKAVLASLWSVADESTGVLMSEFYRLRKDNPNMTKAEAMRQAQLLMIQGKLKPSPGNPVCRSEVVNLEGTKQPLFKCDAKAPYSHPYFWSPFVLIGNWR